MTDLYKVKDIVKIKDDKNKYRIVELYYIGFMSYALIEDTETYDLKEVRTDNIVKKLSV